MKESLKPGIRYEHKFPVPSSKTVPALYPESPAFLAMPEVFATGFLVGFFLSGHALWPSNLIWIGLKNSLLARISTSAMKQQAQQ